MALYAYNIAHFERDIIYMCIVVTNSTVHSYTYLKWKLCLSKIVWNNSFPTSIISENYISILAIIILFYGSLRWKKGYIKGLNICM